MNRSVLDRLISNVGLALAAVLLIGGALLTTASSFINAEVHNQLASQKTTMPTGPALESLNPEDKVALDAYAGKETTDKQKQAKAFADHYIGAHMTGMSGGRTYEEVSGEYIQMTDKSTSEAQKLGELRQTLFMGNTLRGMLLNAYAFGTMASIVAYVGAVILVLLSLLGFRHARQTVWTQKEQHGAAGTRPGRSVLLCPQLHTPGPSAATDRVCPGRSAPGVRAGTVLHFSPDHCPANARL